MPSSDSTQVLQTPGTPTIRIWELRMLSLALQPAKQIGQAEIPSVVRRQARRTRQAPGTLSSDTIRVFSTMGATTLSSVSWPVRSNLSGAQNSFFGEQAGDSNQTGNFNSFFGEVAGFSNTSGSHNTMIGSGADVGSNNLTNATAIGAKASVNLSNSLVLGSIAGVNGATASVNV